MWELKKSDKVGKYLCYEAWILFRRKALKIHEDKFLENENVCLSY